MMDTELNSLVYLVLLTCCICIVIDILKAQIEDERIESF